MTSAFARGTPIVVRHVWRRRIYLAWPVIVVDDGDPVVTWTPPGTPLLRPERRDELPFEQPLVERPWDAPGLLQVTPRDAAHSLWLFDPAWYVNLQEPLRRTPLGYDTADQLLDLVRSHDGRWRWKDDHELDAAVERGFMSAEEAAAIRSEAERVIAADPVPTGWEDFEPDPEWPLPRLPHGWDVVS